MKGVPWCASLPVVDVPKGATPKPFTVVLPYYENPRFLRTQAGWWATYPAHVKVHLSAIVVDDGSPGTPAATALAGIAPPFQLRLFRIGPDIRWNWLAARNIGAHHAETDWLMLTDMDHVLPASTAEALIYGKHDPAVVYAFSRIEHTGETLSPHSASFFMTKAMFWKIGGYDEIFSGKYGSDGQYRKRLSKTAKIEILLDRLIRHEYVEDSSTTDYLRKQPEDAAVGQIAASLPANHKPKVLSFPYAEVYL